MKLQAHTSLILASRAWLLLHFGTRICLAWKILELDYNVRHSTLKFIWNPHVLLYSLEYVVFKYDVTVLQDTVLVQNMSLSRIYKSKWPHGLFY